MKIILDYNRTLFDPDTDSLYPGVVEMLRQLSKKNELFLVSKNELGRKERLLELGIKDMFKGIVFTDEKSIHIFKDFVGNDVDALVVGDRVRVEISLGNRLGLTTVWVRQGKFADETPKSLDEEPKFTIRDIVGLGDILERYGK